MTGLAAMITLGFSWTVPLAPIVKCRTALIMMRGAEQSERMSGHGSGCWMNNERMNERMSTRGNAKGTYKKHTPMW
jgi:hypothetical protein